MHYRPIVFAVALGAAAPVFATATAGVDALYRYDVVQPVPGNVPLVYSVHKDFSDYVPGLPYYDPAAQAFVYPPAPAVASASLDNAYMTSHTLGPPLPTLTSVTSIAAQGLPGELHVKAAFSDTNTPVKVNAQLTSTATWVDSIDVTSPTYSNGNVAFDMYIDGQVHATGGAVTEYFEIDYFNSDPNAPNAVPFKTDFARQTYYGTFVQPLQQTFYTHAGHSAFTGERSFLDADIAFNTPVFLRVKASCTVYTLDVAVGASVDDSCDLSHSVYWGGITGITSGGQTVADAHVTSVSGFNYLLPSPHLPPVGGVPEPATWALFVAGFGLVGVTTRQRRRSVA